MEFCLQGERRFLMKFYASEKGQGFVEYALIFVLVVLVAFVLLPLFAPYLTSAYNMVINNL
jgi:Flp pilus assembly pilin Flp